MPREENILTQYPVTASEQSKQPSISNERPLDQKFYQSLADPHRDRPTSTPTSNTTSYYLLPIHSMDPLRCNSETDVALILSRPTGIGLGIMEDLATDGREDRIAATVRDGHGDVHSPGQNIYQRGIGDMIVGSKESSVTSDGDEDTDQGTSTGILPSPPASAETEGPDPEQEPVSPRGTENGWDAFVEWSGFVARQFRGVSSYRAAGDSSPDPDTGSRDDEEPGSPPLGPPDGDGYRHPSARVQPRQEGNRPQVERPSHPPRRGRHRRSAGCSLSSPSGRRPRLPVFYLPASGGGGGGGGGGGASNPNPDPDPAYLLHGRSPLRHMMSAYGGEEISAPENRGGAGIYGRDDEDDEDDDSDDRNTRQQPSAMGDLHVGIMTARTVKLGGLRQGLVRTLG